MSEKTNTPELTAAAQELKALGKKYNLRGAFVCTKSDDKRTIFDTFLDSNMFALQGSQVGAFVGDEAEVIACLFQLAYKELFKLDAVIRAFAPSMGPDIDIWQDVHDCFETKLTRQVDNLMESKVAFLGFEGTVDIKKMQMRAPNSELIAKLRMITNVLKGRITPDYKAMEESIPAGMSVENLLPKED